MALHKNLPLAAERTRAQGSPRLQNHRVRGFTTLAELAKVAAGAPDT